MSALFDPCRFRDITFRNRIFVSPMCQYSSENGFPTPWHLVHLGSRAVGGAALVVVEATAVNPEGRITFWDSGIWSDDHSSAFGPITNFIRAQGSVAGIQLAHAGRKASTDAPWRGGKVFREGPYSWMTVAPSPVAFRADEPAPHELTIAEIKQTVRDFADAARRSLEAGFEVIELHMAHGYLVHQFLSPLSNERQDEYGGALINRMRFALEVASAVRAVWPDRLPLFVRISATDWAEGGWNVEESLLLARELKSLGVDLIDCSSGGAVPGARVPVGPGYQVPFAERIRREAGIATGAVGLITGARQAEEIIASGQADVVFLARQLLRDPYWPLHAARELGVDVPWPDQYLRAKD
jgi:2,4-dienoyl-CoA reductase-like NADH-dependent reductase (Old Yellow Enzyme family)